jgi:hypothetical protein
MLDSQDPASATLQAAMQKGLGRTQFRTFAQIRELFGDLELVEPGLALIRDWRPAPVPRAWSTTRSSAWPTRAWPGSPEAGSRRSLVLPW